MHRSEQRRRHAPLRAVAAAVSAVMLATAAAPHADPADADVRRVIVTGAPGASDAVAAAVAASDGHVVRAVGVLDGVVADVPSARVAALAGAAGVRNVTADSTVTMSGAYDDFDAATERGSVALLNRDVVGASAYWDAGHVGDGVDVAIVDTGVAEVAGLDAGQVLHGPDLSFDSQVPELTHTDGYGHGTYLAGIIAGREADAPSDPSDTGHFSGVAPGARILSMKIGDHAGVADVSQAIAAIDWVVQNRDRHGLNVRVLNLAFGYDSNQPYTVDPLAYAAEAAWRNGIVVVAAAGNGGGRARLSSPAYSPHVIAVGATESNMTATTSDDEIPEWSSCDPVRNPDVVAPGRSVVSLRVPGSVVDETHPESRVTATLTRGSGTSQATAFVSGAAALIVDQRPGATPDDVRALLNGTANRITRAAPRKCQGHGVIDLRAALDAPTPDAPRRPRAPSDGSGSLEAARGRHHVADASMDPSHPDAVLTGERDIFGAAWDGPRWAARVRAGTSWAGNQWNGNAWTGNQWNGNQWNGVAWESDAWSGNQWNGVAWEGNQWNGVAWEGSGWTGNQWNGVAWEGNQWNGNQWNGVAWEGNQWNGNQWNWAPGH